MGEVRPPGNDTDWMADAECRGMPPEVFYGTDVAAVIAAKAICAQCVVRDNCLEMAMTNGEKHGVWGGTSERERSRIRRQRSLQLRRHA